MNALTIYAIPVSLYCAKLRIVLRHKQLDWQEVAPPGGYGSKEYANLVPSGSLPAMRDGDLVLADSEAIAEYLNEKYPQHPLLPDALKLRAKVRELSRFHDTRLEPALRKLFAYIAPDARDMTVITQQAQQLNSRLAELAQLLGSIAQDGDTGHTFQTPLTLGDCGFAISFLWIEQLSQTMGFAIVWPPIVIDYKAHIQTLDAIAEELADYQPKLTQWLATTTLS